MTDVAYALALGLAGVFAWAGVAKLRDRSRTERSFAALGVPPQLAAVVPVVELAIAVGLVVDPLVAIVALLLLAAFTIVLVDADDDVSCACFGSATSEPVSWVQVLRNVLLMCVAAVAAFGAPGIPSLAAILAASGVAAIIAIVLTLADIKRRTGTFLALELP